MVSTSVTERWNSLCPHRRAADPPWRQAPLGLSIRRHAGLCPSSAGVTLRGEVHACCEGALERLFVDLLDAGVTSLQVHLADVVFLDGAGARTLASTARKLESRGGRLRVQQPAASATKLLEMTGLGRLLAPPIQSERL